MNQGAGRRVLMKKNCMQKISRMLWQVSMYACDWLLLFYFPQVKNKPCIHWACAPSHHRKQLQQYFFHVSGHNVMWTRIHWKTSVGRYSRGFFLLFLITYFLYVVIYNGKRQYCVLKYKKIPGNIFKHFTIFTPHPPRTETLLSVPMLNVLLLLFLLNVTNHKM